MKADAGKEEEEGKEKMGGWSMERRRRRHGLLAWER